MYTYTFQAIPQLASQSSPPFPPSLSFKIKSPLPLQAVDCVILCHIKYQHKVKVCENYTVSYSTVVLYIGIMKVWGF